MAAAQHKNNQLRHPSAWGYDCGHLHPDAWSCVGAFFFHSAKKTRRPLIKKCRVGMSTNPDERIQGGKAEESHARSRILASASQMIMASLWVEIALGSALGKQAGSMLSSSHSALSCSSGVGKWIS